MAASNPKQPPLRLGLVGCGRLGTGFYIPALAAARGVRLVGFAEPDLARSLEAREALRGRPGAEDVRACDSVTMLLDSVDRPDAVVVAGPPSTHLEHAAQAAAAGVPALVEKPPAEDAAAAADLARLQPAPRIGFNRRFSFDPALPARIPVETTELELELRFLRARWRPHVSRSDALADAGSHLIDLALWIAADHRHGRGGNDLRISARAIGVGARRAQAEIRCGELRILISCAVDRGWRERVVARDGDGRELRRWETGSLIRLLRRAGLGGSGVAPVAVDPDPLTASLIAQLEAFGAALRGGECSPLANADDGLRTMLVLDAIRRSEADGRRWIEPGSVGDRVDYEAGQAAWAL